MKYFTFIIIIFLSGIELYVPDKFLAIPIADDVKVITITELEKLVSERNGKPLLINVWATWCVPCREEFPDLISFVDEYKESVEVIGLSVDFPNEIDTKVIPFLEKLNPSFPNYIVEVSDPEKLINFLNKEWNGAIPATFYFNPKGELIKSIIGKSDISDFEKLVSVE